MTSSARTTRPHRSDRPTRRDFLATGVGAVSALACASTGRVDGALDDHEKLPVAAIVTTYYPISHADVLITKILRGYQLDGGAGPGLKVAGLYVDQSHEHGMERQLANEFGIRLARSIDDAITLGTDQVQVAGVLSIGEHGNYPDVPGTQQKMYPRRRFFDAIAATFRRCGKVVPVFNDKHFSYRWDDARAMFDAAQELKIPLIAGSSLPLTWRFPALELPQGCEIESALAIGYGHLEHYGFHAIETLQCMIERRAGGESGVAAVRAVNGPAVRETERSGLWSSELFAHALSKMPGTPHDVANWPPGDDTAVYMLEHNDGLKSAIVMANRLAGYFGFAARLKGRSEPVAAWFKLQDGGVFGHFGYQMHAIEQTIRTGRSAYPPERTLLTTGVLDRCMHSLAEGGRRFETPELAIRYAGGDWPFANHPQTFREMPHDY